MNRDATHRKGQGLVEFAFVLPLFLLLLFGMVEFGRAWMTKNILTGAAREAVRVAAVQENFAASDSVARQRATQVLNSAGIGVPPAVVEVNFYEQNPPTTLEPTLEVIVNYPFPIIVGGFFGWTGDDGTIMLTSTTSMRTERYEGL